MITFSVHPPLSLVVVLLGNNYELFDCKSFRSWRVHPPILNHVGGILRRVLCSVFTSRVMKVIEFMPA